MARSSNLELLDSCNLIYSEGYNSAKFIKQTSFLLFLSLKKKIAEAYGILAETFIDSTTLKRAYR